MSLVDFAANAWHLVANAFGRRVDVPNRSIADGSLDVPAPGSGSRCFWLEVLLAQGAFWLKVPDTSPIVEPLKVPDTSPIVEPLKVPDTSPIVELPKGARHITNCRAP